MKIGIRAEKSTRTEREWMATASAGDLFTVRRFGPSEIRARERALSTALRRAYEIMEDGQIALADVFPIKVVEGSR